jgi:prepilin-type N-terminal cleavage/methylation domain-containing protein
MTPPHRGRRRTAFTLVEILVVIALIGVLAGILLVAVGGAVNSAKAVRTKATMESMSAAIDSFVLEHGSMPGIVPVATLHTGGSTGAWMTNTQNILLHLMGGARVSPVDENDDPLNAVMDTEYTRFLNAAVSEDGFEPLTFELQDTVHNITYRVVVRTPRIGEGPWINGQDFAPYLSPKESELREVWPWGYDSSAPLPDGEDDRAITGGFTAMPDLADAWGQPIIIFQRERSSGPVIAADGANTERPQFRINGIDRYLGATNLGQSQTRQLCRPNENSRGSRLGVDGEAFEREYWLYLLLSHPAMRWEWGDNQDDPDFIGTGRAGYALLSSGPDGVFFARDDGPRDDVTGVPVSPTEFPAGSSDPAFGKDHERLKEFDDVIMYGGS